MKQNLLLSLLFSLLNLAKAQAMPPEYQVNVRESCRQAAAGAYLKAYDDKVRSTGYQEELKQQIGHVRSALKTAEAKADNAAKALAGHDFDAGLAAARDDTAVVVRTLKAQLADYGEMLGKNTVRIKTATAEEAQLRRQLEPVFTFDRSGDKEDGGYPNHLSYRSPCPPYRALCPLPVKDRDALSQLRIGGQLPEDCKKYLSQPHPR